MLYNMVENRPLIVVSELKVLINLTKVLERSWKSPYFWSAQMCGNHDSCTAYRTPVCVFRMWMKNVTYRKRKETSLIVSCITERCYTDWNLPSLAELKVINLTTSSAVNDENLIQSWICNKDNLASFSVIILLDINITFGCLLLMTYITVWEGAVNMIQIQIVLFTGFYE